MIMIYTVKTFTVKYQQLWLPELYCKKYGSNILGFTVLPETHSKKYK